MNAAFSTQRRNTMDRATLLLRADMLHSMAMEFNAHELDNDASRLASQTSAYGHCMNAATEVLTELYGVRVAGILRYNVAESGESPSDVLRYLVNSDHAEAIETADAEMHAVNTVPAGIYVINYDGTEGWIETTQSEVRHAIATGQAATFYRKMDTKGEYV
jgi:hypothetical protein